jgi:hypothetical protein
MHTVQWQVRTFTSTKKKDQSLYQEGRKRHCKKRHCE